MSIVRFFLAAIFGLALTILGPFTTGDGITYIADHGKLLLVLIAIINVIVGGGLSGSFFAKDWRDGFRYWLQPYSYKGTINPTYGFGAIILAWNIVVILFFIEA